MAIDLGGKLAPGMRMAYGHSLIEQFVADAIVKARDFAALQRLARIGTASEQFDWLAHDTMPADRSVQKRPRRC